MRFADDVAVVSLSGKFLAGGDGPYLQKKVRDLIDAGTTKVILDFSEVPYIDSTGLGFLTGIRSTAQDAGAPTKAGRPCASPTGNTRWRCWRPGA